MLRELVSADDEGAVSAGLMFEHVPGRGHREAVNRVWTVGGGQLVRFSFERESSVADPVGKREQNRRAVSRGVAELLGEIRGGNQNRAHLARERKPKIEEIESVRRQDRRARPCCIIMKGVDCPATVVAVFRFETT